MRLLPVSRRPRSSAAVLAGAAAMALAVVPAAEAASGAALTTALKRVLGSKTGVKVTKATCPKVVDARKGRKATCQLTFATGDRSPVRVTFTTSTGKFDAVLVNFLTRNLEDQLEDRLGDRGVSARVTCPASRKARKGDRFTCTARADDGRMETFTIVQTGKGLARVE